MPDPLLSRVVGASSISQIIVQELRDDWDEAVRVREQNGDQLTRSLVAIRGGFPNGQVLRMVYVVGCQWEESVDDPMMIGRLARLRMEDVADRVFQATRHGYAQLIEVTVLNRNAANSDWSRDRNSDAIVLDVLFEVAEDVEWMTAEAM